MPLSVSRTAWDVATMPDKRVTHFWDGEQITGKWFAEAVDHYGYGEVAWDMYYLYGPQAVWETVPTPLVDSGGTIYRKRDQLEKQIDTLLNK